MAVAPAAPCPLAPRAPAAPAASGAPPAGSRRSAAGGAHCTTVGNGRHVGALQARERRRRGGGGYTVGGGGGGPLPRVKADAREVGGEEDGGGDGAGGEAVVVGRWGGGGGGTAMTAAVGEAVMPPAASRGEGSGGGGLGNSGKEVACLRLVAEGAAANEPVATRQTRAGRPSTAGGASVQTVSPAMKLNRRHRGLGRGGRVAAPDRGGGGGRDREAPPATVTGRQTQRHAPQPGSRAECRRRRAAAAAAAAVAETAAAAPSGSGYHSASSGNRAGGGCSRAGGGGGESERGGRCGGGSGCRRRVRPRRGVRSSGWRATAAALALLPCRGEWERWVDADPTAPAPPPVPPPAQPRLLGRRTPSAAPRRARNDLWPHRCRVDGLWMAGASDFRRTPASGIVSAVRCGRVGGVGAGGAPPLRRSFAGATRIGGGRALPDRSIGCVWSAGGLAGGRAGGTPLCRLRAGEGRLEAALAVAPIVAPAAALCGPRRRADCGLRSQRTWRTGGGSLAGGPPT
ncbi:hypothetical protein BU14_0402s0007 [Porphyra umbilicalis]|uniref:Uncharacterized protein n=1 Tax=Porphyra umbilicalis TaxID=2786 RepID=A0A1X6NW60_PORUM|nr:hypothetical protein BU14_0402s0007 [Porphyra umbilicalis]|eukprot:OSX72827.1 hypothetical protein BU14_0402s0007 [Porphyra umbilicalis]